MLGADGQLLSDFFMFTTFNAFNFMFTTFNAMDVAVKNNSNTDDCNPAAKRL